MALRRLRNPGSGSHVGRQTGSSDAAEMRPVSGDALIQGLYTSHGAALLAYVHGLGVNHQDAEDVVQETMVRAWRHRETLDPGTGAVRGWLYTVARHIVIDRLRVRSAIPVGIEPSGLEPTVDDHQANVIDRVTVLDALARLTPEHRVPVVEVYYRGRTVDSVAASVGVPAGTIKSRLHYGLRNLRRILDAEDVGVSREPPRGTSTAPKDGTRGPGRPPAVTEETASAPPPTSREESREH